MTADAQSTVRRGKLGSRTAAVVALCLGGVALGGDWAQFRGPAGLGASIGADVPIRWSARENVIWKTDLPGAGTSSPIVFGDQIYLTCYRGEGGDNVQRQLVAMDRASGAVAWTRDVPSKLPEQTRIREGHGYASNTPVADAEQVYVFFGKSGVFAFDLAGKPAWQADVGSNLHGWGSAASPILYENLVIVNASVESESLVALDRRTGRQVWRARGIRESWNTPILVSAGGKTELVLAIFGKVLGFDPTTGQSLWECATEIPWYMVPSVVSADGVVYCIGGRQGGGALAVRAGGRGDVTSSHRLWKVNKGSNVSSPVFHDGHLYWASDSLGVLYCAEAASGRIVYEQRLSRPGEFYASPVLAGGNLYYPARDGRTWVIAAQPEFQQLAVNELGERSTLNASPAIADGRLSLRTEKALYCIGNRAR